MDATDLRALVLDAARAQALRVITIGRDNQLQIASLSERVDVNGVEWHIQTSYSADQDAVRVTGHPHEGQSNGGVLAALFGGNTPAGAFDWSVPAQWLEATAL
jgi:hypothetical protein